MPNSNHEAMAFFKLEGGNESGQHTRLGRVLGRLDGVLDVRVDYILDTISIRYDSKTLTREDIKKKVDRSNGRSK